MRFINKLIKSFSLVLTLFIVSFLIITFKISKENIKNPFCKNLLDNEVIILNHEEIKKYEYKYDCSTLYFIIEVDESLNKEMISSLLLSIGKELKEYDCFTHFEIHSASLSKTIYAVINLKTNELSIVG